MNQFLEVAGGIFEGLRAFLVSSGFPALYVDADKDKGIFDFASRMYILALFRMNLSLHVGFSFDALPRLLQAASVFKNAI